MAFGVPGYFLHQAIYRPPVDCLVLELIYERVTMNAKESHSITFKERMIVFFLE